MIQYTSVITNVREDLEVHVWRTSMLADVCHFVFSVLGHEREKRNRRRNENYIFECFGRNISWPCPMFVVFSCLRPERNNVTYFDFCVQIRRYENFIHVDVIFVPSPQAK